MPACSKNAREAGNLKGMQPDKVVELTATASLACLRTTQWQKES